MNIAADTQTTNLEVTCRVPRQLFKDWQSRGLVHNLQQQGELAWHTAPRGKGIYITCDAGTMRGLQDDARWLLDPCMDQDAGFKRVCRQFIDLVDTALTNGAGTGQHTFTLCLCYTVDGRQRDNVIGVFDSLADVRKYIDILLVSSDEWVTISTGGAR